MRCRGLVLACALAQGCYIDFDVKGASGGAATEYVPPASTGGETPTGGLTEGTGGESGTDGSACEPAPPLPDAGAGGQECDQWVQDCPDGFKCMPYSADGDNAWESLKCTPVMPNAGGVGESCTVLGSGVSGYDSCAEGLMCWLVVPETCTGKCFELCKGAVETAYCTDAGAQCYIISDIVLALCIPSCDPLSQLPCEDGDVCVPNPMDPNSFMCVYDASGAGGQVFDPCEYVNSCDPGLNCVSPELAEECESQVAGCCLPFCKLSAPDCPGVGQECLPWYEAGMAPPGYEDIGVCGLPQ